MVFDDDIGYLFALSTELVEMGFSVVPAHTLTEAESLINRLDVKIDLLLFNPRLPEAERVGQCLRARNPALIIVPLTRYT